MQFTTYVALLAAATSAVVASPVTQEWKTTKPTGGNTEVEVGDVNVCGNSDASETICCSSAATLISADCAVSALAGTCSPDQTTVCCPNNEGECAKTITKVLSGNNVDILSGALSGNTLIGGDALNFLNAGGDNNILTNVLSQDQILSQLIGQFNILSLVKQFNLGA